MELEFTDSSLNVERNSVINADLHKAWHLLALLLDLGRPAPPAELASRCVLFQAAPEFIEFICSIPNSPLCLTNQWLVTPSLVAFAAFKKLMSNLNAVEYFVPRLEIGGTRPTRIWEDVVRTYYRKRKRAVSGFGCSLLAKRAKLRHGDGNEDNELLLLSSSGAQRDCTELHFPTGGYVSKSTNAQKGDIFCGLVGKAQFPFKFNAEALSYILKNAEFGSSRPLYRGSVLDFEIFSPVTQLVATQKIKTLMPTPGEALSTSVISQVTGTEAMMCCLNNENTEISNVTTAAATKEQNKTSLLDAVDIGHSSNVRGSRQLTGGVDAEGRAEEPLLDTIFHEREMECMVCPTISSAETLISHDSKMINAVRCADMVPDTEEETEHVKSKDLSPAKTAHDHDEQMTGTTCIYKGSQRVPLKQGKESSSMATGKSKAVGFPSERPQPTQDKSFNSSKQKRNTNYDLKKLASEKGKNYKEKRTHPIVIATNNQTEQKPQPDFESFTIEEEEGSGGYGTVYKARRKDNAATFAIKYPHPNANRHHIHNELKMLERFGGKNYIIKYEGSFKAGSSECLVLEHFEHDRPEVLKREINIFELQWFSYCMFRALSGLHRQGVVHRDVKPGNFLFSRKVNKGYLIDFNLAMDLHQKYGTTDKPKASYDTGFNPASLSQVKSLPPTNNQKLNPRKSLLAISQEAGKGPKPLLLQKNLKRKAMESTDLGGGRNVMKSQGADGSGITSAKDATSTRTNPSQERFREPVPCQGRKELISLAHKAMQAPNHGAQSVSAPKRKRIAALPGSADRILARLTPMPLHSAGVAVAGAGPLKNKGDGKQKREGPCVGTKGFRAPEVLLRSPHQGPKMDIWSAGVTLLYLMTGRSPFTGEPEQNIREIAKLRGSEDIWEVAKLHNRESSFPVDLLDVQFLPCMKLRDWCRQNTKRPDFLKEIPRSLFDLVDKCLTVNPRQRISADEALRHEFFDPCHEALRKGRLQRKDVSFDFEAATTAAHALSTLSEPCKANL